MVSGRPTRSDPAADLVRKLRRRRASTRLAYVSACATYSERQFSTPSTAGASVSAESAVRRASPNGDATSSTSTLPAVARARQMRRLPPAQIGRQTVHRADEIGDDWRRHAPRASPGGAGQALPNDIGFRAPPFATFGFDVCHEPLRESHG